MAATIGYNTVKSASSFLPAEMDKPLSAVSLELQEAERETEDLEMLVGRLENRLAPILSSVDRDMDNLSDTNPERALSSVGESIRDNRKRTTRACQRLTWLMGHLDI